MACFRIITPIILLLLKYSSRQTGASPHNTNESLETISESSDEVFQVSGTQDFEGLVQILQDFINPLHDSSVWGIDIYVRSCTCWIPSSLFWPSLFENFIGKRIVISLLLLI